MEEIPRGKKEWEGPGTEDRIVVTFSQRFYSLHYERKTTSSFRKRLEKSLNKTHV